MRHDVEGSALDTGLDSLGLIGTSHQLSSEDRLEAKDTGLSERAATIAGFLFPATTSNLADAAQMLVTQEGWQVVEAGYPEYPHAFGHHLGRAAHDGATVLGPRWERYGQTPFGVVEAGNVFAIELGVAVGGYGYVGLEEDVLVTEKGAQWLSEPQTEVWLVS